ncbi:MAG: DUF2232 domain-containing protein [Deltaproteobacteria bacterium]|nr:DUF2232 domain-containing protein [Deltaproteobacteria bacterium]
MGHPYFQKIFASPRTWLPQAVLGTTFFFSAFLVVEISPAFFFLAILPMILSPIFLVLTTWRYGNPLGVAVAALSAGFILLLFNLPVLLIFVTQFAVVGILLGDGLRKKIPAMGLLYSTSLVSTLLIIAAGAVYLSYSGMDFSALLAKGSESLRLAAQENARRFQLTPEQKMQYEQGLKGMIAFVKVAYPALIFMNAFSIVCLNLLVPLHLAGYLGLDRSHVPPLEELTIPFGWVWGLILSGMLYLLKIPYLKWVGLNIALIFLLAYLIQGYGILTFFLQRTRLPRIVKGVIYIIFLLQPTLILLLCGAGLFETWFHFRQRAAAKEK